MIRDFQKALRTAVFHRNLRLWTPGEFVSPSDRFSETCIAIRWVDKEKNEGSCSFLDREWFSFILLSLIFLLNLSNIHHEGAKRNRDSFFFPGILLPWFFLPVEMYEASLYASSVTQLQGRQKSSVPKNIHPPLFCYLPVLSSQSAIPWTPCPLQWVLFSFSLPLPI